MRRRHLSRSIAATTMICLVPGSIVLVLWFGCVCAIQANNYEALVTIFGDDGDSTSSKLRQSRHLSESQELQRPKIHTFFEHVPNLGMIEDENNQMLDFWKSQWTRAGFDPIPLNTATAKQSPDFAKYKRKLKKMALSSPWNQHMFIRWIAMSVVGGWYADYDVYPLQHSAKDMAQALANSELTLFDYYPSLMHGSVLEYKRFTKALLDLGTAMQHRQNQSMFWTDSLAVRELMHSPNVNYQYERDLKVIWGKEALKKVATSCDDLIPFYAVHIDHNAVLTGERVAAQQRLPKYRLSVAQAWLEDYRQRCAL